MGAVTTLNMAARFSVEPKTLSLQEGLPFWIFWFLLGIIGLLVLFIFLRDKELRRRIDFFFLSARHRSLQLHLRRQIKRERKRKSLLWVEMGLVVYQKRLLLNDAEAIFTSLDSLEKKKAELQAESLKIQQSLDYLVNVRTSPPLSSPKPLSAQPEESSSPAASVAATEMSRKVKEEIKSWKRRRAKIEERIKDLEEQERVYFLTLGRLSDTFRVPEASLDPFYQKIDAIQPQTDSPRATLRFPPSLLKNRAQPSGNLYSCHF
jgi:hypothetical protein